MGRWNQAPFPRDQIVLFSQTVGERIPEDHPVRLMVEFLEALDWSPWERTYVLCVGQPPIHPRILAGAVLYGLTQGIRSSRRLEWACMHAVDFIWLVEGRTPDHATICNFRTRFAKELKDLFRQVVKLALNMGLANLNQIALDGTRVKANSGRSTTATAATLEERIAEASAEFDRRMAEIEAKDREEQDLFGEQAPVSKLPPELRDAARRQERLRKALAAAQEADAKRPAGKRPASVPVADPEAALMPNKEGGFAPNYNPVAAVEGQNGLIVEVDVLNAMREAETVMPVMERIAGEYGQKPKELLADGAFATGDNLTALAAAGIEAVMPVEQIQLPEDHPVMRADPQVPVAPADWEKLPRRPQTRKLDRAAFRYDPARNCYWCPVGRVLTPWRTKNSNRRTGGASTYQVYRCASCEDCELAKDCLKKETHRTVSHDQHEGARQEVAARMAQPENRKRYAARAHLAETPNALIKAVLGLRQFLHRGLAKVCTEWIWACTAFNLRKLLALTGGLRAFAAVAG